LAGYDAVVLAGGAARRLGGADKPAVDVGGVALLDRVLAALPAGCRVVVVGPPRPVGRPVAWTREDPPGGGPAAGLAAGLALTSTAYVAVLACDLPFLQPDTVEALAAAALGRDGALLVDATGRDQLLCGVHRRAALAGALATDPPPTSIRALLAGLDLARLTDTADAAADCDTPADLARARARAGDRKAGA
jgi:molybdopterin-guanine dinucleotide biosynthesis protein A